VWIDFGEQMAINKSDANKTYTGLGALDKIGMDMHLSRTYNKMASFSGIQTLRASSVNIDSISPQRSGKAYATKTGMTLSKTSDIPPLNGYLIAPQLCVDTQNIWAKIEEKIEEGVQKNSEGEFTSEQLTKILQTAKSFYQNNGHLQTVEAIQHWEIELGKTHTEKLESPAISAVEQLRHIISHTTILEDDPNIIFTKSAPNNPSQHDGFNKKDREHLLENIVAKKEEGKDIDNFRKIHIGAVTESVGAIFLKAQKNPPEYSGLEYDEKKKIMFFQSAKHPQDYYCISLSELSGDTNAQQMVREQSPRKALELDAKIKIPNNLLQYPEIRQALRYEKFTTLTVKKANKEGNHLSETSETIPVLSDYKGRPFFGDWDSLFQSVPLDLKLPTWGTTPINTFVDPIISIQTLEALTRELANIMFSYKPGKKLNESMKNLLEKLERDGYVMHNKNSDGSGHYSLELSFFVAFISERAGCITPYEFLTGQLTNYAYRGSDAFTDPPANPKQHGNEVRNPYPPSKIDGVLSHHTALGTEVTNGEQACVDWYLNEKNIDFFRKNGLDINPKFNLDVWGPIIAKQIELANSKESDYIPPAEVMEAYLNHLPKVTIAEQNLLLKSQHQVLALDKQILERMKNEWKSNVSGESSDMGLKKAFLEKNIINQKAKIKNLEATIGKDVKESKELKQIAEPHSVAFHVSIQTSHIAQPAHAVITVSKDNQEEVQTRQPPGRPKCN